MIDNFVIVFFTGVLLYVLLQLSRRD